MLPFMRLNSSRATKKLKRNLHRGGGAASSRAKKKKRLPFTQSPSVRSLFVDEFAEEEEEQRNRKKSTHADPRDLQFATMRIEQVVGSRVPRAARFETLGRQNAVVHIPDRPLHSPRVLRCTGDESEYVLSREVPPFKKDGPVGVGGRADVVFFLAMQKLLQHSVEAVGAPRSSVAAWKGDSPVLVCANRLVDCEKYSRDACVPCTMMESTLGMYPGGEVFKARQLQVLRTLIVPTFSGLCHEKLSALDAHLRRAKRIYNAPFGGVQVILLGSLCETGSGFRDRPLFSSAAEDIKRYRFELFRMSSLAGSLQELALELAAGTASQCQDSKALLRELVELGGKQEEEKQKQEQNDEEEEEHDGDRETLANQLKKHYSTMRVLGGPKAVESARRRVMGAASERRRVAASPEASPGPKSYSALVQEPRMMQRVVEGEARNPRLLKSKKKKTTTSTTSKFVMAQLIDGRKKREKRASRFSRKCKAVAQLLDAMKADDCVADSCAFLDYPACESVSTFFDRVPLKIEFAILVGESEAHLQQFLWHRQLGGMLQVAGHRLTGKILSVSKGAKPAASLPRAPEVAGMWTALNYAPADMTCPQHISARTIALPSDGSLKLEVSLEHVAYPCHLLGALEAAEQPKYMRLRAKGPVDLDEFKLRRAGDVELARLLLDQSCTRYCAATLPAGCFDIFFFKDT